MQNQIPSVRPPAGRAGKQECGGEGKKGCVTIPNDDGKIKLIRKTSISNTPANGITS
ncbi:MAG: hypothetical protein PHP42_10910 [Bacteroidota bacterium]|nr:hypothetical protein [Bacteroidota bacterium]